MTHHRAHDGTFHCNATAVLAYQPDAAAPFKDVTRQGLFEAGALACPLRYFEVAAGGHTTLERHAHVHAVTVVRGHGPCLVGETVHALALRDLIQVPPLTWHPLRAPAAAPLGFLCMVNSERVRPQLPSASDLETLRMQAAIADFIRT